VILKNRKSIRTGARLINIDLVNKRRTMKNIFNNKKLIDFWISVQIDQKKLAEKANDI